MSAIPFPALRRGGCLEVGGTPNLAEDYWLVSEIRRGLERRQIKPITGVSSKRRGRSLSCQMAQGPRPQHNGRIHKGISYHGAVPGFKYFKKK
jgi:hypothetical protein